MQPVIAAPFATRRNPLLDKTIRPLTQPVMATPFALKQPAMDHPFAILQPVIATPFASLRERSRTQQLPGGHVMHRDFGANIATRMKQAPAATMTQAPRDMATMVITKSSGKPITHMTNWYTSSKCSVTHASCRPACIRYDTLGRRIPAPAADSRASAIPRAESHFNGETYEGCASTCHTCWSRE